MAKEGGKRAGEGVHGGCLRFRVLGGGLCLPTPRRRKPGVYVSRVPGGPPPKPAPNLEPLPNQLGLQAPSRSGGPAATASLLPASPPFNLLPHWGPGSFSRPSVPQLTVSGASCIPVCPLKMGGMEPFFAQSLSLSL